MDHYPSKKRRLSLNSKTPTRPNSIVTVQSKLYIILTEDDVCNERGNVLNKLSITFYNNASLFDFYHQTGCPNKYFQVVYYSVNIDFSVYIFPISVTPIM